MKLDVPNAIECLKERSSKCAVDIARARFVPVDQVLGVTTGDIRKLAKDIDNDFSLAEGLWETNFLEAKALAILICPIESVDTYLLNRWVAELGDWSTCDLFVKTLFARRNDAIEWAAIWSLSSDLYTKRAGLALIANYCMRSDSLDDEVSAQIIESIEKAASDDRDHVRKACCWALREFGKSNSKSHEDACSLALDLIDSNTRGQNWVGRCAYRELENLVKVPQRRRLIVKSSKTGNKTAG